MTAAPDTQAPVPETHAFAPAVVCSRNAHKLVELTDLLLRPLEPMPRGMQLPPETGTTFTQNARIKALGGAAQLPRRIVVADDSGLCVDALDGAPGVYSARFAGAGASDAENNLLLVQHLAHIEDPSLRSARFVCVLVAVLPDGTELVAEGAVEGCIAAEPAGDQGFGYDPLFVPRGFDTTFGVLGPTAKAELSHRARAARELSELLSEAGV